MLLPGADEPSLEIELDVAARRVVVERVVTRMGQSEPERHSAAPEKGILPLRLTHPPVYVLPADG